MDNSLANEIKRQKAEFDARVVELAAQMKDGLLTADEAAQSLGGFHQKQIEASGRKFQDAGGYYRLRIDQELPGYQGASLGRHFRS